MQNNNQDFLRTGGCMCGAVRYALTDDDTWDVYCHCKSCRRHTGAPVVMLITCRPGQVKWTRGERARYVSSPGRYRGFCRDCGSSLTWEATVKNRAFVAIHVSTADTPEHFAPGEHVFTNDALSWFDTADNFTRYPEGKFI